MLLALLLFFLVPSLSFEYECGHYVEYDDAGLNIHKRPYVRLKDQYGVLVWESYDKNSGEGSAGELAFDPKTGDATIIGYFKDSLNLLGFRLKTKAEQSIYILRCNFRGEGLWIKTIEGASHSEPQNEIINLSNGNIITGFLSEGGGTFDGKPLRTLNKGYLTKITQEGRVVWMRKYGKFKPAQFQLGENDHTLYGSCAVKEKKQHRLMLASINAKTGRQITRLKDENIDLIEPLGSSSNMTVCSEDQVAVAVIEKATRPTTSNTEIPIKRLSIRIYSKDLSTLLIEKRLIESVSLDNYDHTKNKIAVKDMMFYKDGTLDILLNLKGDLTLYDDDGNSTPLSTVDNSRDIGLWTLDHELKTQKLSIYGDSGFDAALFLSKHQSKRGFGGCYDRSLKVEEQELPYVESRPIPFNISLSIKPTEEAISLVIPAATPPPTTQQRQTPANTDRAVKTETTDLLISPNPVNSGETITLALTHIKENEEYSISLHHMNGSKLANLGRFVFLEKGIQSSHVEVVMASVKSGVYLLYLVGKNGVIRKGRIIVH